MGHTPYTPGPWRNEGGRVVAIAGGRDIVIALTDDDADTNLITAAPEMLEALQSLYAKYCTFMHSEYDYPDSDWTPERDNDETALAAEAAIAKALKAS